MRKFNFLTVLGAVCFLCAVETAASGSRKSGSVAQAPRITLKSDLVVGAAEGNENLMLGSISRIDLDGAGNIYILDYKDRLIRIFKNDGSFLRNISVPAGQGPKEATNLSGIAVTPKGRLYVNDAAQGHRVRSGR